ncbi:MAG: hypothetical protein QNK36_16605 [Colwellia sp.]|nr:hypothetical protein [Colwellia sp.]
MISQNKTSLLTNKVVLFTLVVTLVWIIFDVNQRFLGQAKTKTAKQEQVSIKPMHLPNASAQNIAELTERYLQYRSNDSEKKTAIDVLSAEQQAKQQGELKALFIGDNKLELKAIFNSIVSKKAQRIVMLKVTNIKSNQQSLESYGHLDNVYGYQLNVIDNHHIELNNLSNKKQLIGLSMYNRKKQ